MSNFLTLRGRKLPELYQKIEEEHGFKSEIIYAVNGKELFKAMIMQEGSDSPEDINYMIKDSYQYAEKFCAYLETEGEKESGLIIN